MPNMNAQVRRYQCSVHLTWKTNSEQETERSRKTPQGKDVIIWTRVNAEWMMVTAS